MFRIALTSLTALVLWAAVLAAGAGGAIRTVSTSRSILAGIDSASRLEQSLLADAADGRLDRTTLIAAALIAGGETDAQAIARHQQEIDRLARQLRPAIEQSNTPIAKAEALLVALHRHVLIRRYIAAQSDIAIALESGDFNCLSSVILYVALGRSLGVDVRPAVLPGHIVAVLNTPDGQKHVETTCAEWFAAVRDGRAASVNVPAAEGGSTRHDRSRATPLTDTELIALVYYNQGYEHLTHNRFADAWSANQKALALDPNSRRSRGNFLATINNWSLALCRQGKFREASRIVTHGLHISPRYAPLLANNRHLHRLWVEQLVAQGRWHEAVELLRTASRNWPTEPYFARSLNRIEQRKSQNRDWL